MEVTMDSRSTPSDSTMMASDHSTASMNQTEPDRSEFHTTSSAEQASEKIQGISRASVQVVANGSEPTSTIGGPLLGGAGTHQDIATVTGQESWDAPGTEVEMTVFRSIDMDHNAVSHSAAADAGRSLLSGTMVAELTKDSPPSYESVIKARAPIIIPTEKTSTCDNRRDVITTQPLSDSSSTIRQPTVTADDHNALTSLDPHVVSPEEDSITAQLNNNLGYESTQDQSRTCCTCTGCQQCLSDCCDGCARCWNSEEMECFCAVS